MDLGALMPTSAGSFILQGPDMVGKLAVVFDQHKGGSLGAFCSVLFCFFSGCILITSVQVRRKGQHRQTRGAVIIKQRTQILNRLRAMDKVK